MDKFENSSKYGQQSKYSLDEGFNWNDNNGSNSNQLDQKNSVNDLQNKIKQKMVNNLAENMQEKMAKMKDLKKMQEDQYAKKKSILMAGGANIMNPNRLPQVQQDINQMHLDNQYKDDESTNFDPFYNPGGVGGSKRGVNLELKAQDARMDKNTTTKQQIWTPEDNQKKQSDANQLDDLLNDLEDLEEIKPIQQKFEESSDDSEKEKQRVQKMQQNYPKQQQIEEKQAPQNIQFEAQIDEGEMVSYDQQKGDLGKKKKKKKKKKPEDEEELRIYQEQERLRQLEYEEQRRLQEEAEYEEQRLQQLEIEQARLRQQQEVEETERKLQEIQERQAQLEAEKAKLEELARLQEEEEEREEQERLEFERQMQIEKDQIAKKQQVEEEKHSRRQQEEEKKQDQEEDDEHILDDAPKYYQPGIIPQAPLKPSQKDAFDAFMARLFNPYLPLEELRDMYMKPLPALIGQVQCSIVRSKAGFDRLLPKYTLQLSNGNKYMLTGKKQGLNATSNYMITIDQNKFVKDNNGYLGKVRSNFLGTEFNIFDSGKNPKDAKTKQEIRRQYGVVQYETNVLGSKGPRRMKVLMPMVSREGIDMIWPDTDAQKDTIQGKFDGNEPEDIMFFFNKPPKWNEQVQAFVLNFNGRVDKASVKNFQLIDEYDDNKIYMQFGRVGSDQFNMDCAFPFSLFQAYGISLSSFDFKFACE